MQLPDETIEYNAQGLLAPPPEGWTPLAELQGQHLLPPARLRALSAAVTQVRSHIASERELVAPPPDLRPLEPGFIDLPQKLLDNHRRKAEQSDLGRVLSAATRLRSQVDRVVVLGAGGSCLGARALV